MKIHVSMFIVLLSACMVFGEEPQLKSLGARRALVRYKLKAENAEKLYKAAVLRAARDLNEELGAELIKIVKTGDLDAANQVKAEQDRIQKQIQELLGSDKVADKPGAKEPEADNKIEQPSGRGKLKPKRQWLDVAEFKAGDKVQVAFDGVWKVYGHNKGLQPCGPDGVRGEKGDKDDPSQEALWGSVIGKMPASSDPDKAKPFSIGRSISFVAKEAGILQVRINVTDGYLYKCEGELDYMVKITPGD